MTRAMGSRWWQQEEQRGKPIYLADVWTGMEQYTHIFNKNSYLVQMWILAAHKQGNANYV